MSTFGPGKVSRLSAWLAARQGVYAERELPAFLSDRLAIAKYTSPRMGEPQEVLVIEPDGRVTRTPNAKYAEQDPLAGPADSDLRRHRGAVAADYLLHRGYLANERLSRCLRERQTLEAEREGLRSRMTDFVSTHATPGRLTVQMSVALLGLVFLAAGELGALTLVVADWFGVDLGRVGALAFHPVETGAVLLAATGIFAATVMLAEKAFHAEDPLHRLAAVVALFAVGIGLGIMRAAEIEGSGWQQAFVFFLVTVAIPCAVAAMGHRAAVAYTVLGEWRKLSWRERDVRRHLVRVERDARVAERDLDAIVQEFGGEYMKARAEERTVREAWQRWLCALEASLAEYRLAYLSWAAHARSRPVGNGALAKVAGVVLVPLLFSLGSCAMEPSEVHVAVVCDRSSSGAELSCNQQTILDAGRWWSDQVALSGGTFEVWVVGDGIDTRLLTEERYPERFGPPVLESKRAWRQDFESRLQATTTTALPTNQGSAVAEALWRVSRRLEDAGPGGKILVIASDLRQVTPGVWNFEEKVPPAKEFLGWLRTQGLTPRLPAGTTVIICGVHSETPAGTSRASAMSYNKTRDLWERVFKAWGVETAVTEQCFAKPMT